MADNGAVPDQNEKHNLDGYHLADPEAGNIENELDDSKAKFINSNYNGGVDDTKVIVTGSDSNGSFIGLGKDELKRYAEDPFWVRLRWILFILFWVGWLAMLVSAIVIIVLAPRCPTRPDLKWYNKDVAYNVYSKSFFDGDKSQDGYGDLEGIKAKQGFINDYIKSNILWLSSIVSTQDDNDRAVLDYKMLDQRFGDIDDFRAFCKGLFKQGKQVIMDLIPNQTGRNHTWFQQSVAKSGKYADYYVWSDTDPGWKRADGSAMWVREATRGQFYLSQFEGTADLNLTNDDVIEEFKDILVFWAGVGVNGFHINDLEYLTENTTATDNSDMSQSFNFPANADVVDSLRTIVDGLDNKPGREKLLFGTVTSTDPATLKLYSGDDDDVEGGRKGLHMVSVTLSQLTRDVTAAKLQQQLSALVTNETEWLGWRLTTPTPGTSRVYSRVGEDRMMIAHALQAFLPGSAQPYYGDEIGMADGSQGRKTVSPMQWTKGSNAGFTEGTPWTPVNPGYKTKNLDTLTAQLSDNKKMESIRAMNELRGNESLQFGKALFCAQDDFLIISRDAPGFPSFLVLVNMGSATEHYFQGDECVGERSKASIVFTSHSAEHKTEDLDLSSAVHVASDEVLVLKFPA